MKLTVVNKLPIYSVKRYIKPYHVKVKDLHLGRVVLLNTPDNNNTTNKNNESEQLMKR